MIGSTLAIVALCGSTLGSPVLAVDGEDLLLSGMPAVLSDERISPKLRSGLTNTFLAQLSESDDGTVARIDLRWEPWDEVFLASVTTSRGFSANVQLASEEDLATWWKALRLPILPAERQVQGKVSLQLTFLPFSASEQQSTRDWLNRSLGGGRSSPATDPNSVGGSSYSRVLHLMVSTSVSRKALVQFEWILTVPDKGDP